ncbi:unnamed protein product [Symbiodinium sp. CCMP2592]|nr:unnamed protein product [Symbiodinium sp. CCMP2592]
MALTGATAVCRDDAADPRLLGRRSVSGKKQFEQKFRLEASFSAASVAEGCREREGGQAVADFPPNRMQQYPSVARDDALGRGQGLIMSSLSWRKVEEAVQAGWATLVQTVKVRETKSRDSKVVGLLPEGRLVKISKLCSKSALLEEPVVGWITLCKGGAVLRQDPAQKQPESSATMWAVANVMARYGATPTLASATPGSSTDVQELELETDAAVAVTVQAVETPASEKPFHFLPSVGTWLSAAVAPQTGLLPSTRRATSNTDMAPASFAVDFFVDHAVVEPKAEAQEIIDQVAVTPFRQLPSVGTWLSAFTPRNISEEQLGRQGDQIVSLLRPVVQRRPLSSSRRAASRTDAIQESSECGSFWVTLQRVEEAVQAGWATLVQTVKVRETKSRDSKVKQHESSATMWAVANVMARYGATPTLASATPGSSTDVQELELETDAVVAVTVQAVETPGSEKPFHFLPSVATWLSAAGAPQTGLLPSTRRATSNTDMAPASFAVDFFVDHAVVEPKAEAQEIIDQVAVTPFRQLPSVGTWLSAFTPRNISEEQLGRQGDQIVSLLRPVVQRRPLSSSRRAASRTDAIQESSECGSFWVTLQRALREMCCVGGGSGAGRLGHLGSDGESPGDQKQGLEGGRSLAAATMWAVANVMARYGATPTLASATPGSSTDVEELELETDAAVAVTVQAVETPGSEKPFHFLPSVATWLSAAGAPQTGLLPSTRRATSNTDMAPASFAVDFFVDHAVVEPKAEAQEIIDQVAVTPFRQLPSVGTWLSAFTPLHISEDRLGRQGDQIVSQPENEMLRPVVQRRPLSSSRRAASRTDAIHESSECGSFWVTLQRALREMCCVGIRHLGLWPASRLKFAVVEEMLSSHQLASRQPDSFHVGSVGPVPRALLEKFVCAFALVFLLGTCDRESARMKVFMSRKLEKSKAKLNSPGPVYDIPSVGAAPSFSFGTDVQRKHDPKKYPDSTVDLTCGGATVDTQKVKYAKTPGCHFGTEPGQKLSLKNAEIIRTHAGLALGRKDGKGPLTDVPEAPRSEIRAESPSALEYHVKEVAKRVPAPWPAYSFGPTESMTPRKPEPRLPPKAVQPWPAADVSAPHRAGADGLDDARPQSPGEDAGQTEALAIEDKVFSSIGKQVLSTIRSPRSVATTKSTRDQVNRFVRSPPSEEPLVGWVHSPEAVPYLGKSHHRSSRRALLLFLCWVLPKYGTWLFAFTPLHINEDRLGRQGDQIVSLLRPVVQRRPLSSSLKKIVASASRRAASRTDAIQESSECGSFWVTLQRALREMCCVGR